MAADERLRARQRLRKRPDFRRIYDQGARTSGPAFTLFALPNDLEHGRLGVAATRKFGSAVERNRAKRLVREVFRRHGRLTAGLDVVVVPRREFHEATYAQLEDEFRAAVRRLSRIHARAAKRTDQR
jgi:ribonuclease P protein component